MMTVLPNLKMSVDQYNYSLLLQTKPQHPAEHHHPRELGKERRRDPLREGWYLCPLPEGTYPVSPGADTRQTADTGLHLLFHIVIL